MRRLLLLLTLLLFSCATVPKSGPNQAIDLLITHGTVVTITGEPISDGAIAVDAGEIKAVGPAAEIQARFSARKTLDAHGMAVLPGLVNSHTHASMTLFRGIADDRDLMDWLQHFIFPAEKNNVDAEFVRWGTRLAAAEMIRSGTTTFADMYYFEAVVAREVRAAGLRAVLGETLIDFPAPDNKSWPEAVAYCRAYAAEFRGDPLITAALAPHAPFTVSREHLKEVRALADELHVPILIHLAETEAELRQVREKSGLTPVQYLDSLSFLRPDVVAAHVVHANEADIQALKRTGAGVAHCPESNMMLASGIAPVAALRRAGVAVGIGTDGPAGSNNNLDMIEEMASTARLQKVSLHDPKALSARDVLRMATLDGARVLGLDDKIGSIEPGKRADLIVIDLRGVRTQPIYSVESAIVYSASGSDVVHTLVDGRFLMLDRVLLTLDEKEILDRASEYRRQILLSLGH